MSEKPGAVHGRQPPVRVRGWDDELLAAELQALDAAGFDLGLTGSDGADLGRLLASLDEGDGRAGEDVGPEPPANGHLKANPADLRIMHVEGDSILPTLKGGDVVLVDLSRTAPTPPGIFLLFDGFGLPSGWRTLPARIRRR